MNALRFSSLVSAALLLGSCTLTTTDNGAGTSSDAASSEVSAIRATPNVTYTGVVQTAGISIYMEGTHRLTLPEGKFILLESSTVDLNGYVGEKAKIFGSIRPTVEAGGMIMHVDRIELQESSEASSSEERVEASSSTSSISSIVSSAFSSVSMDVSSLISSSLSLARSSAPASEESRSADTVSEASSSVNSSEIVPTTSGTEERIDAMSRQDLAPVLWTQQYCTSHIGFCIPVHKNWWFRSFGTTDSELWRVEINSEPIENLRDGPIVVRLLTDAAAASDGTVKITDNQAVYFKSWTLDRHFEITADVRLQDAIKYIGTHMEAYEQDL